MTSPRHGAGPRRREGLTLVEVMVVVIVIAIATTGITIAFGAVNRSELKSACMRIVAASRFAYAHAVTRDKTVRIVFDLDAETMALEEAHGRVRLARMSDPRRAEAEHDGAEAADPWAAAQQRLETTLQPTFGESPFSAILGRDGSAMEKYAAQRFGGGVQVLQLTVPHEPSARTSGQGSIYFFPGGLSEQAVVQLSDGGDTIYTVAIHALTGRARVFDHAYEPDPVSEDADDEDLSELGDPG